MQLSALQVPWSIPGWRVKYRISAQDASKEASVIDKNATQLVIQLKLDDLSEDNQNEIADALVAQFQEQSRGSGMTIDRLGDALTKVERGRN